MVATDQLANSYRYTYDDSSRAGHAQGPDRQRHAVHVHGGGPHGVGHRRRGQPHHVDVRQPGPRRRPRRLPLGNEARRDGESDDDAATAAARPTRRRSTTTSAATSCRAERPGLPGSPRPGRHRASTSWAVRSSRSTSSARRRGWRTTPPGTSRHVGRERRGRSASRTTRPTAARGARASSHPPDRATTTRATRRGRSRPSGGVITWEYDDDGRPVAITEPRGHVAGADPAAFTTRYTYDPAGNPVAGPRPARPRHGARRTTRSAGSPRRPTPTGSVVRYGYDAADRLRHGDRPGRERATSRSLRYTYDANGQVIRRRDPLGHETTLEYDRAGRTVASTDPLGPAPGVRVRRELQPHAARHGARRRG